MPKLQQLPAEILSVPIDSNDTTPIEIVPAVAGKTVKLWGILVTKGTSLVISTGETELSGPIETTGLLMRCPTGNRADCGYPDYESAVGETLTITPSAGGMGGTVWYTQD